MFYTTDKNDHGLALNPWKACIVPRPIAWITSCDAAGVVNIAPFSYFNAIADHPPMLMFATCSKERGNVRKDTVVNAMETGEFVVNMVPYDACDTMNATSAALPHGESEASLATIELIPSQLVKPPRIQASPIQLECVHVETITLPATHPDFSNYLTIGKVVGVHIDDALIVEGKLDAAQLDIVARMGYDEYARIERTFRLTRPQPSKKK